MARGANFTIEFNGPGCLVLLRDIGPHSAHPTITNDAENVVASMRDQLWGRRLFYIDSENHLDELRVCDGRFVGFLPGAPRDVVDALVAKGVEFEPRPTNQF